MVEARFHPGIRESAEVTARHGEEGASSFVTYVMGARPVLCPDWTNTQREVPSGWPPVDSMPLTGDLLARTVSRLERTELLRIAEGIFIRPVTAAVKAPTTRHPYRA